jgi:hypothetical protein
MKASVYRLLVLTRACPTSVIDFAARHRNPSEIYRSLLRCRSKALRKGGGGGSEYPADSPTFLPSVEDIVGLVQKYPTTNGCTHFAAVLDPLEDRIAWCGHWLEPADV